MSAIVCLGDLQPSWIEILEHVPLPKLGVYGNHDRHLYIDGFGIDDIHLRRIELDHGPASAASRAASRIPADVARPAPPTASARHDG